MINKISYSIIEHVFSRFGLLDVENNSIQQSLLSNNFILDKKITLDVEGEKQDKLVYGQQIKIENFLLKVISVYLEEDEIVMIIQMDNYNPYGLLLDIENKQYIFDILYTIDKDKKEEKWIPANVLIQSKFLYGIEQVFNVFFTPEKLLKYDTLYKTLVDFLNHNENKI